MTSVIGFTGFSNSGKTTLISKLVAHFTNSGLKVAVIKHDAHGHYKEAEGTDSTHYRQAGAAATVVVSPTSYMAFRREAVDLEQIVEMLQAQSYELILVEGFKNGTHDKIALFLNEEQAEIFESLSQAPAAAASLESLKELAPATIPFFNIDDISGIAAWIEVHMKNTI
ncbi:molybdopterin-guanine dinucleotide biosynthesis protein B [Paenibacillus radicis (ex Xue et al. 2023)]|uniref:Molybdopterin-guanine dinucleotide biosynthesis protein B n=1 Tax=Paenibacillus radicis (ex Xue et al. 2023) TaxID=2972489 RepID=A0ABT1YD43_9BACL|nr:molybdopterin-guanine dinucleotide biosynthesis protein B [Paenibacillus radicis (ex Xue et al. 2023)]MCR8631119.1 molybdopterin-guanine dinucleotide biosynthesis protein B [Paenibacillus radicis (ex Xue et al. 2023)]